mmetsp:Transcript_23821/g.48102  ORF Transcript_23821/g.48102 Transcript_23821/m.48102 type:complete len:204 (-) Transcript_23821:1105-1716(-)
MTEEKKPSVEPITATAAIAITSCHAPSPSFTMATKRGINAARNAMGAPAIRADIIFPSAYLRPASSPTPHASANLIGNQWPGSGRTLVICEQIEGHAITDTKNTPATDSEHPRIRRRSCFLCGLDWRFKFVGGGRVGGLGPASVEEDVPVVFVLAVVAAIVRFEGLRPRARRFCLTCIVYCDMRRLRPGRPLALRPGLPVVSS